MHIALIADDTKKELMIQFCIAYCGILSKHTLCATGGTGKVISDATGLEIETLMSGNQGGEQQMASRISFDEIDVVVFFRKTVPHKSAFESEYDLLRMCDSHNIPVATNIATAEVVICALERGDLDWRELINPKSEYNQNKKK